MYHVNGLIFETSERDFLLGGDNIKVEIEKRPYADEIIYEYNQLDLRDGHYCCVPTSCIGSISDLFNIRILKDQLQEIVDDAVNQGILDLKGGMKFYQGIDLVRKWWNKNNPNNQIISFKFTYGETFFEALNRGHSVVGGYRGNSDYNLDASDGTLSGKDFKPSTYGHCIRIRKTGKNISVIDNYLNKKKTNKYILEHLDELITNKVFYNEFYIFLPKDTMTPEQIEALEAQKAGIWNGQRPNDTVTRQEAALMAYRASKM